MKEPRICHPGSGPLLSVRDLSISTHGNRVPRTITRGVDLDLDHGQSLAIVGESGSGKSITARAIVGLLPRGLVSQGRILYRGRDLAGLSPRGLQQIRGKEIALMFQDPFTMLNPLMRCGDQIVELLRDESGRRLSRRARRQEAIRRLAEVGIDEPRVAGAYPFQLSGGMRQRVGIAAALAGDPHILIADEPCTALDVTTQHAILSRLKWLQETRGMSLILVTHDLRLAMALCDHIRVMYAGSILEAGPTALVAQDPQHPYTVGLLNSEPPISCRLERLPAIPGGVPDAHEVLDQCSFAARCEWAQPECLTGTPPLRSAGPGRLSACRRLEVISGDLASTRRVPTTLHTAAPQAEPSHSLVAIRELRKVFSIGTRHEVAAIRDVSLEIGENESVGLVGESGSGKTTIGRCIAGLEQPTAGSITINGVDASDYGRLAASSRKQLRRTLQMVFQDPYTSLNPARSVGATLREALLADDPRRRNLDNEVSRLLSQVGIPTTYSSRKPIVLSGGERQRVAIARALASRPRLIICDEPVSALDVSVQAQILNLLASIRQDFGLSYLFITHDLAVARQATDRMYVLHRGQVVETGPTGDLLDRPNHSYTRRLVASIPSANSDWLAQDIRSSSSSLDEDPVLRDSRGLAIRNPA